MNEKFESSYEFLARIQRKKMQESKEEVKIDHTLPSNISGEGNAQKVDLKKTKKKVDAAKPAKPKVAKDPNDVEHTGATKAKSESVNENILMLSAIEKIMNPKSSGKDGALGVAEYIKTMMGNNIDPQLQQYLDSILGIIERKSNVDKVEKDVDTKA